MKTKMESLTLPTPDKFTDSWLARVQLKPGTNAREREVFELSGSGLGVRIRANGGKSLTVQKAKHGVELRRTLGAWPQLTLPAARKAVEALIGRMAAGFDVNQEHRDKIAKAKAPKPLTLAELTDRWERRGLDAATRQLSQTRHRLDPIRVQDADEDAGRGPDRRSDRDGARRGEGTRTGRGTDGRGFAAHPVSYTHLTLPTIYSV